MTDTPTSPPAGRQVDPAEARYREELAFLAAWDEGARPYGWRLTPRAVVTFVMGSGDETLRPPKGAKTNGVPSALKIGPKFIGDRGLVERCVVTLAGDRGLLLVGEPGTAKSMLSELLGAAVSGISSLTVQGTAGTTEDQLRYGWNYALLLAKGPSQEALVPSPVSPASSGMARRRSERIETSASWTSGRHRVSSSIRPTAPVRIAVSTGEGTSASGLGPLASSNA